MSRTVKLAAFNIVTHPHSPQGYIDLFKNARSLRQPIQVRGETHALLATAYQPDETSPAGVLTGEVFTFLQLDPTLDWFDVLKGEQATDEQIEEVSIPENLRPHLRKIRYALFPNDHLFVYVRDDARGENISPGSMEKFLARLLNDNRLLEKSGYQKVEVRLVQDSRALESILESLTLEKIEIVVRLPNPGDTPGDAEAKVAKEMEDENLEELKITKKAASESGVHPNQRTKNYMAAAASNGYVWARGTSNDGTKREFNTSDSPLVEPFEFSNDTPFLDRFLQVARELRRLIKRQN